MAVPLELLTAVIACPECGIELEGNWRVPDEAEDTPEPALHLCGSCGESWVAEYPGYGFRTEAG